MPSAVQALNRTAQEPDVRVDAYHDIWRGGERLQLTSSFRMNFGTYALPRHRKPVSPSTLFFSHPVICPFMQGHESLDRCFAAAEEAGGFGDVGCRQERSGQCATCPRLSRCCLGIDGRTPREARGIPGSTSREAEAKASAGAGESKRKGFGRDQCSGWRGPVSTFKTTKLGET